MRGAAAFLLIGGVMLASITAMAEHPLRLAEGDQLAYAPARTHEFPLLSARFDDGARADVAYLFYNVTLQGSTQREILARIELGLDISSQVPGEIGGRIRYTGESVRERARTGEFGFVERFPLSDRQRAASVISTPEEVPFVEIPGPFHLEERFEARIDPVAGTVTWPGAPDDLRWLLWIDPDQVPFTGKHETEVLHGWPAGPVHGEVRFIPTSDWPARAAPAIPGTLPDHLVAIVADAPLVRPPNGEDVRVQVGNLYDAETGILISTMGMDYVDDVLLSKLGLLAYRGLPENTMVIRATTIAGLLRETPATTGALETAACILAAGFAAVLRRRA